MVYMRDKVSYKRYKPDLIDITTLTQDVFSSFLACM